MCGQEVLFHEEHSMSQHQFTRSFRDNPRETGQNHKERRTHTTLNFYLNQEFWKK